MGLAAFNRARRIRAEREAKAKAEAEKTESGGLETLTVAEIKERLTEQGVEFPARANKAELIALLEQG